MFEKVRLLNKYATVYDDMYSVIYRFIYFKVGDVDDSQDLCQEVFTRLFMKFDGIQNHYKWVWGAVRYVLGEYFRKRNRRKEIDIDGEMDSLAECINDSSEIAIIIDDILSNEEIFYDKKLKNLFELIAFKRFTYQEAARVLSMKRSQVKYQYNKIVSYIIQHLKGKGLHSLNDFI